MRTEEEKAEAQESAAENSPELDENQLLQTLESNVDNADQYYNSEVGKQRDDTYKAYYGRPTGKEKKGRSAYQSLDVFDQVEGAKASLLEIFTSNDDVVRFSPHDDGNEEDLLLARNASKYCNYVFNSKNKGFDLLEDVCHDGLLSKTAIVKCYWKEDIRTEEETFEGVPTEQLAPMLANEDIELVELDETQININSPEGIVQASIASGAISRKVDYSKVCLETIPPEDFLISPQADCIPDSDFVAIRYRAMVGEMVAKGYDYEELLKLTDEASQWSQGKIYRDSIDSGGESNQYIPSQDTRDRSYITFFDAYIRIDVQGTGEQQLIHCVFGRGVLLDYETVSCIPFFAWQPHRISHRFYGISEGDLNKPIQKAKTSIQRSIIDNCWITNTGRMVANLGMVKNPKDLIENRIGGVIDITSNNAAAAIAALPTPALSPLTTTALGLLDQDKDSRSAVSRLSQGLNADVINKQNATDMIDKYMNAANKRLMRMARSMAEFLKDVMLQIVDVGMEYEDQEKLTALLGENFQFDPQAWKQRLDVKVKVALTPEERLNSAQQLLMLDSKQMTDPTLQSMITPQHKYNMYQDIYNFLGLPTADRYLLDPEGEEFQQQSQQMQQQQQVMEQQQQQMQQMMIQQQERQLAIQEQLAQNTIMMAQFNAQMDQRKQAHTEDKDDFAQALDFDKNKHDKNYDNEKLALEEKSVEAEIKIEKDQKRSATIN